MVKQPGFNVLPDILVFRVVWRVAADMAYRVSPDSQHCHAFSGVEFGDEGLSLFGDFQSGIGWLHGDKMMHIYYQYIYILL